MSEGKHDLAHELPEFAEQIRALKLRDERFSSLTSDYHALAKELHRVEAGVETPADDYVEGLKKQRLYLLDEIVAMLRQASN